MSETRRRRELARADRVLPGLWRLRLPLPWPGVPHVNAFAIAAGNGVVLVDTGLYEPGGLRQLERALDQAGLRLEHVRLLVCTHAHSDHYGLAGPIVAAAGCELWMHPNHSHMSRAAADPERGLRAAPRGGTPEWGAGRFPRPLPGRAAGPGLRDRGDRPAGPRPAARGGGGHRPGPLQVYETPGHAPSHVVLHQPDRGLLLSGDHLLGRVSLFYDYGWTPDPAGEFLRSLDVVADLDVQLVLAGHGRPVRDAPALVAANRREVERQLGVVRAALAAGPRTPFEIVPLLVGEDASGGMAVSWGLSQVLSYLDHLELLGEAERVDDGGEGGLSRWAACA